MDKNNEDYAIEVQEVYKTFNVYLDKANSLKEKMLFWKRNRKEVRQVLKGINLNIKIGNMKKGRLRAPSTFWSR